MQRPRRGKGKSGARRPAGQAVLPRLSPRMAPMAAVPPARPLQAPARQNQPRTRRKMHFYFDDIKIMRTFATANARMAG